MNNSFKIKETSIIAVMIIMLTFSFLFSCEEPDAPPVNPATTPIASFSIDLPVTYKTVDGVVYAYVTARNYSSNSNRWKWERPGSREPLSGPISFETNKDTSVTQVYVATPTERNYQIKLTAYSDVNIGLNPDGSIKYETFTSAPNTHTVSIKKP